MNGHASAWTFGPMRQEFPSDFPPGCPEVFRGLPRRNIGLTACGIGPKTAPLKGLKSLLFRPCAGAKWAQTHLMTLIKSICVYCGSARGRSPRYVAAARELGAAMAERQVRLVYGGAR